MDQQNRSHDSWTNFDMSFVAYGRISICPLSPTGMMLFCKSSADNGRFSNMLHHAS